MDRQIRNILVLRNDRFGEFLLNIPALRALKETFPGARIIAITDPYVRELAGAVPFIDEIMAWGRQGHSLFEKLGLVSLLKKKKIDIAVMLNPSKEFNILTYLAGIPIRVGYDRKCGFLLTHKIKDKKYLGQKHEIEYNLELVGLVGAKTEDKALSIKIGEESSNNLPELKKCENLVALHPYTSDPVKQWPKQNFIRLAKKMKDELRTEPVIVGAQAELWDTGDLINLTGKTSLTELAGLLKKCRLLVSGDSGPVHLACAAGTPVLAIFRNDIAAKGSRRWGPSGSGSVVVEKPSLIDITVEEVFEKAKRMLNR